jgi:hypothetical protein
MFCRVTGERKQRRFGGRRVRVPSARTPYIRPMGSLRPAENNVVDPELFGHFATDRIRFGKSGRGEPENALALDITSFDHRPPIGFLRSCRTHLLQAGHDLCSKIVARLASTQKQKDDLLAMGQFDAHNVVLSCFSWSAWPSTQPGGIFSPTIWVESRRPL